MNSWQFSWIGVKKDQRGKNHLYSWFTQETNEGTRYFRAHGMISTEKPYIHIVEYYPYYNVRSTTYIGAKLKEGYKAYSFNQFNRNFPNVVIEIDTQLVIEKLKR